MSSVTQRISKIKQPRGGYLPPSLLTERAMPDSRTLSETENVHASVIGLAVDYLTRMQMGDAPKEAFDISLLGASCAELFQRGSLAKAQELLAGIEGLDDPSVINAAKLVTFDVWYRAGYRAATNCKGAEETNPDPDTIGNIKIMVERNMKFLDEYGPVVESEFTFEPNGYTKTVDAGDGDILTADAIWDFKVSKSTPTKNHTLQLLMYWIMGRHSGQDIYRDIRRIGIFNPRLCRLYYYETNCLPPETIAAVETDVIGYGK